MVSVAPNSTMGAGKVVGVCVGVAVGVEVRVRVGDIVAVGMSYRRDTGRGCGQPYFGADLCRAG